MRKPDVFRCTCGFETTDEGKRDSHVKIMDGVYRRRHEAVR